MSTLTHRQVIDLLQKASDRTLSSQERTSVDAHLAECKDCRSYSLKLNQLQTDLRDNLSNRWSKARPRISTAGIEKRIRRVAMKNRIKQIFAPVGIVVALVAAFFLVGSFLPQLSKIPATANQQSTKTSSSIELTAGSEATGNTYLEGSSIVSPFPPAGIGKICSSTSSTPQVGDGSFIWPTNDHFLAGKDYSKDHPAIDINGAVGDPVRAADSGVVIMAGPNTWGYGNLIILDHGQGWYSLYGHLDAISVICGQNINKGVVIGTVGKSGNTTKPELHFQVLSGNNFVDPWSVLPPLPEKCDNVKYTVQPGDTLLSIAKNYGVSVDSIHAANNFLNDAVYTEMVLTIPLCH